MKLSPLAAAVTIAFFVGLSPVAWGQSADKARRVGILMSSSRSDPGITHVWEAFVSGLREQGWEEGKNVVLEGRFAGPDATRFPELAAELIGHDVDIILASQTQAIAAARAKTTTIPIIMVGAADPVGSGLVSSLARPGGNITGLANQIETVSAKNLELLVQNKPGIKRVGVMFTPDNSPSTRTVKAIQEEVAPRLGVTVLPIGITKSEDLTEAFATIVRNQVDGLLVLPTPVVFAHRAKIAEFAIQQRLPTAGPVHVMARDGLLMSYGYDNAGTWRRAASFVDRIFKGAKPAELPVEQVDQFQLIINVKTARAIGFDAASLLSRAEETVE